MNKFDVKTGDTLLVRSDSFLSKTIVKVMKRYGKHMGYNTDIIFSHAGRFIWIDDDLYVFESVSNGYNPRLFEKHYDLNESDMCIMRRKEELTPEEQKQTRKFCLHLDTISNGYQYWNFLQWLVYVYLHIDTFKKGGRNKFEYCYESEAEARKNLNPDNYGYVDRTDFFQLYNDPNYDIIYQNIN